MLCLDCTGVTSAFGCWHREGCDADYEPCSACTSICTLLHRRLWSRQAVLSNELSRAMEPVRRLPATLAAALPVTDVTALQRSPATAPLGYALPVGPSPQARRLNIDTVVCSEHTARGQSQRYVALLCKQFPNAPRISRPTFAQALLQAEREQLRTLLAEAVDATGQKIASSQVRCVRHAVTTRRLHHLACGLDLMLTLSQVTRQSTSQPLSSQHKQTGTGIIAALSPPSL